MSTARIQGLKSLDSPQNSDQNASQLLHPNLEYIYDGIASLCSQSVMTVEIVATEDENGSPTETHWGRVGRRRPTLPTQYCQSVFSEQ